MRRDIQKGIKDAKKRKIFYLSGVSFALILLCIAIIFMFYTNFVEHNESSKLSEATGLSEASKGVTDAKQASSEIGKSVNEVKNETNTNEIKNELNNNVIVVPKAQEDVSTNAQAEPEEIKETAEENNQEVANTKEETKARPESQNGSVYFSVPEDTSRRRSPPYC